MSDPVYSFSSSNQPSNVEVVDARDSKIRPLAIASLVLSLAWLMGIGSLLGVIFGFVDLRGVKEGANLKVGSRLAIAGIILGLVGLVPSAIIWSNLATHNASNADLTNPYYVQGSAYAQSAYSTRASESSVCSVSNDPAPTDLASVWIQGCRDGWVISRSNLSALNTPGFP